MIGRDWGSSSPRPASLEALHRSLEARRDRFVSFTLTTAGRRQWEARTFCGCLLGADRCRCAVGHGDTAAEAIAELLAQLR